MELVKRQIYLLRNGVQTLRFAGSPPSKYSNPTTLFTPNLESFKTCSSGLDSNYDLEKITQISEAIEEATKLTNDKIPWIAIHGKYDSSLDQLNMLTKVSFSQPFVGKLASILPDATLSIRGTYRILSTMNLGTAGPSGALKGAPFTKQFSITGIRLKQEGTHEACNWRIQNVGIKCISNGRLNVELNLSVILEWEESFRMSVQTFGRHNNNNKEVEDAGVEMRECKRGKIKRPAKVSDSSSQHSKIMRLDNDEQSSSETDSDSATDDNELSSECENTRQGTDQDKFGEEDQSYDEEGESQDDEEDLTEDKEEKEEPREAQDANLDEDHPDRLWLDKLRKRYGNIMASRYTIQNKKILGAGSFGVVVKVINHINNQSFAVKIVKDLDPQEAKKELNLLKDIRDRQSKEGDKSRIITLHDHFLYGKHQCMVFKLLEMSLYHYIYKYAEKPASPTPFIIVKAVGYQILQALEFLAKLEVVHADLKPENVMIEDLSTFRIKLIDFGNSLEVKDDLNESGKSYSSFQPLFYRAPEVILGVKYNDRLDMWGLGCILFELRTGRVLFDGKTEIAQLNKMVQILPTRLSNKLIREAPRRHKFFIKTGNNFSFLNGSCTSPSYDRGHLLFNRLTKGTEETLPFYNCIHDLKLFIFALERMLKYDINKRVSAKEAKKFDFFEKVRETLETTT